MGAVSFARSSFDTVEAVRRFPKWQMMPVNPVKAEPLTGDDLKFLAGRNERPVLG